MMRMFMHRPHRLVPIIWCFLFLGVVWHPLREGWQYNRWSLAFLRAQREGNVLALPMPSATHPAAPIWMVSWALVHHQSDQLSPLWEQRLQKIASFPVAATLLGKLYYQKGDWAAALTQWQTAGDTEALRLAAHRSEQQGKATWAYRFLYAAYRLDPDTGTMALVNYLVRQQHYLEAISILQEAIQQNPQSPSITQWRISVGDLWRTKLNDCERAEAAYRQVFVSPSSVVGHSLSRLLALVQKPDPYWLMRAFLGVGWCRYQAEDWVGAKQWFQKAVATEPQRGDGYFAMARLMTTQGTIEEAEKWYRAAVQYNPQARWWWLVWANAHRDAPQPDLAGAIGLYAEIARRFPRWSPVYAQWAWALHLAGDDRDAALRMQQAIYLSSAPSVTDWLRLGFFWERSGRKEHAVSAYKHALQLDPDNAQAMQALRRLQQHYP